MTGILTEAVVSLIGFASTPGDNQNSEKRQGTIVHTHTLILWEHNSN